MEEGLVERNTLAFLSHHATYETASFDWLAVLCIPVISNESDKKSQPFAASRVYMDESFQRGTNK